MPTTTPTAILGRGGRPKQLQRDAIQFVGESAAHRKSNTTDGGNTGGNTGARANPIGSSNTNEGTGAIQQQQREHMGYIQYKTMQKQQGSANPRDRVHTNPFHQTWSAREAIAKTRPSTSTTTSSPLTRGGGEQYTPNYQLQTIGESATTTPTTLSWNKRHIQTPLIKMVRGKSNNWTENADTIKVTIPRAQPFPSDRKEEWNRTFHKLHPIPEEQTPLRPAYTITGPSKPTPEMYELAESLTSRPPTTLRMVDITTVGSPVGVSVAVALLMDCIKGHILPAGTAAQYHNLAHFLMASSTEALLHYLREGDKLAAFVKDRMLREDVLPPFSESTLHPGVTSNLTFDPEITTRVHHQVATRSDYNNIILPFIERFYPTETTRVKTAIQQGKLNDHLRDIVLTPGYFASLWYPEGGRTAYDPPVWVDLYHKDGQTLIDGGIGGSFEDGETPGILDGFAPLNHMGLPIADILNMTPADMKKQAMLTLPPILKKMVATELAADIMIKLAMVADDEFAPYLQPEGFQRCLPREDLNTGAEGHREYRVRLRIRQELSRPTQSNGTMLRHWMVAAQKMVNELGISLTIVPQPYDTEGTHIVLHGNLPDADTLGRYTQPIKSGAGIFDVYCITTCPAWGRYYFPYEDTQAGATFNTALSEHGIVISCEESYPADLIPCVALIGSDSRDRADIIQEEYNGLLAAHNIEIQFQVIWCNLRNSKSRSAMVQCVATTEENRGMVIEAFKKIQRSTRTKLYQAIDIFDMHFIPEQTRENEEEITEIIMTQRAREDEHTRVTLTGLNNCDPFRLHTVAGNGCPTGYTIVETILMGLEDQESHCPVVKVTTDTTMQRCYLISRKEDAKELIEYANSILPEFARWVGKKDDVRLLTAMADQWVQKPPMKDPPISTVEAHTTAVISALSSNTKTFETTVNERLDTITNLLTAQTALIQQLMQHREDRGTQNTIVQAVTDTMHTEMRKLQLDMATKQTDQSNAMKSQLDDFSSSIKHTVTNTFTSQQETAKALYELIKQYDSMVETVNDCTMAYGNEIAVLRVVMDACTHRVNWLVEDIGSSTTTKPPPPSSERLSARGLDMILDAVHEVYNEGTQRVDEGTAVADRSVAAIQAMEKAEADRSVLDNNTGEGRQREHDTFPSLSPKGPTRIHTPPLPDDYKTELEETGPEPARGDGIEHRDMESARSGEIPDVRKPSATQLECERDELNAAPSPTRARRGNCSCCGRGSYALVECGSCGRDLHKKCTKFSVKLNAMVCEQCMAEGDTQTEEKSIDEEDSSQRGPGGGKMIELEDSDSEEDESVESTSSDDTNVSSFSKSSNKATRSPAKRKKKTRIKTPTKFSKIASSAVTTETLTTHSTGTKTTEATTSTDTKTRKKATQATLERRTDTGTIQLASGSRQPRMKSYRLADKPS